jgi:hypothetical protein
MNGIQKCFKSPPLFVSMATAAKFVQPIPIFLAYLAPLDVDVVPIKFHQFLLLPLFTIIMPNVTAGGFFSPRSLQLASFT